MLGPGPFVSAQFHFKVQSNCGGSSETAFAPRMPQCVSPRRRPQKVKPPNQLLRGEGRGLSRKPTDSRTQLPSNRASRARPLRCACGEPRPPRAGGRARRRRRPGTHAPQARAASLSRCCRPWEPPFSLSCAWCLAPSYPGDTSRAFSSLSETKTDVSWSNQLCTNNVL